MSLGLDEHSRNARKLCMSVSLGRRVACVPHVSLVALLDIACIIIENVLGRGMIIDWRGQVCAQVEQLLSKASGSSSPKEALEVLEDCKGKLDTIQGLLAGMDQLVGHEPSAKRDVWKQKVSALHC